MRPNRNNTETDPRGPYAKRYRPTKAEKRLQRLVEAAHSPFETECLLRIAFASIELARKSAMRWERPVRCPWCRNWHLVRNKGGRP